MCWSACTASTSPHPPRRCSAASCGTWHTWKSPTRPSRWWRCSGSRPREQPTDAHTTFPAPGDRLPRPSRGGRLMVVEVQLAALREGDIPGLDGALELIDGFDGAL